MSSTRPTTPMLPGSRKATTSICGVRAYELVYKRVFCDDGGRIRLTTMRGDSGFRTLCSAIRLESAVTGIILCVPCRTDGPVLRSFDPGFRELYAASWAALDCADYILGPCCCRCFLLHPSERLLSSRSTQPALSLVRRLRMTRQCETTRCFREPANRLLTTRSPNSFFSESTGGRSAS